jgi:putative ABC transport system permease protein
VQKEVIMHSYGLQVIILALFGIIIGITITSLLAMYMSIYPIVTPEWSATLYLTPLDMLVNSLILFGAAVVAGYVPAWRVALEDIQKIMRV